MTTAVIGGSGFHRWTGFAHVKTHSVDTPYAKEPVCVFAGTLDGHDMVFLPRHGRDHTLPPHRINYRANIWALKALEVDAVVSTATVGGISPGAVPGILMIPDQVLDYTYGRIQTFFDGDDGAVAHVDMSEPFCENLRRRLVEAGRQCGVNAVETGTYAATQGPRFETAAEVSRLERDGADVVGMTGMPEAALAKELQLAYATIAIIVNPAAGKADGGISMQQVRTWQRRGREEAEKLLMRAVPVIGGEVFEVPPPLVP